MATNPFDQYDQPTAANPFDKFDAPAKPSGAIRKLVADKALGFASGAVGATKAIADAAGAGNKVSSTLADVNTGINDYLSPEAKADQQEQNAIMADAQGKGTWEGIKAGARAFSVAPVQTAVQGLGSVAPILAGSVLTGGAVPAAAVGAGIGVAMGAGTAKGAIFDDIKKRSLASGMNEADATAAATKAQEYTGKNTDQIALGGALGAADALTGVSGAVGRMARGALHKPATQALVNSAERGIIGRAAMGVAGEMPLEAAQGGQEQLAANLAAQRAGFQAGTWDNVASNATLEALASAGPGAAFGALERAPAPPVVPPAPPEVAATPPAAPALQIGNTPDPLLSFPDGTVARRSEVDAHISSLPPEQQPAARARFMGLAPQMADAVAPAAPVVKPSEAMGLNPAAGPMSAAAATAVDTGVHEGIKLQEASAADQAAYEQATNAQEQQDAEQDTIDKPITTGPLAEAAMSDEDKRAILFSNKTVADGGIQYEGTRDGDILNGMGKPYPTRFAAQRRARMEGKDWSIAAVFDGFVARRKDAIDGKSTDLPAVAAGTDRGRVSEPASGVAPGVGATDAAGPAVDAGRAGDQPGREPVSSAAGVDAEAVTNQPQALVNKAPEAIKTVAAAIDEAAHGAATSPNNDLPQPTEAQKIAGNYAKGHVKLNGLDLSIENPAGSIRSGKDKTGKAWENTIQHHYGYIKGTMGNDKDHVDLFVKPETPLDYSGDVFVIDQIHPDTGKFDEHKVMVGFPNMLAAKAAYQSNYAKDWKGMQAMTPMPFDEFKRWVKAGPKNTPLSQENKPKALSNIAPAATETIAPVKPPFAKKADTDHLFGVDQKRAKAIERIAKGTAYFSNGLKAQQFIAQNGLKDTHTIQRHASGANRYDVVAKPTVKESLIVQPVSKPQEQISAKTSEAEQGQQKTSAAEAAVAPEAATPAAPKVGRFTSLAVPNATTQWLGFDGRQTVRADLQALAQRHPEYYESADEVQRDIEFVLEKPDGWYIHKDARVVMFRERIGNNAIPQARVEVEADADSMMVRSVYIGNKRQIAKKMGDKRKILSGFELGGQSPDSLTVAEYLKVLGDGSSRPALPSGSVPEADASVGQADEDVKSVGAPSADVSAPEKRSPEADHQAAKEEVARRRAEQVNDGAKKSRTTKADDTEKARSDYFTPGSIVRGYGGFDEVLAYNAPTEPGGRWSVLVHEVKKVDGQWVRQGKPQDARTHSTQPEARELAKGPADKVEYQAGAEVVYSQPRADGKVFPNAQDRGVAPAQASAQSVAKPTGKIEDGGAVLEGARKLYAKAYAAKLDEGMGMDTAAVPLSKSWPEPDYQRMLDDGADPWAVAFAHAARDEVPTKPSSSWKLKGWVEKVQMMREFSSKVLAGDGAYGLENVKTKTMAAGLSDWVNKVDLYEAVGHAKSLKGMKFTSGQYVLYGGEKFSPAKTLWTVNAPSTAASSSWSSGNWGHDIVVADTKAEAIEKFKAWSEAQGEKAPAAAKGTVFDIYSYRSKPGVFIIGKRLSASKSIDLKTFPSAKEAREYKASHQDELEALLEKAKFVPPERRESNAPRVGIDHRNGADVTSEQFRDTFGFRGEQFGASMPQGERQSNLNQAYDALMDLAGVIGIPPKALSLNGELGLAFGARGIGGKNAPMAHYERDTTGAVTPNRVVINLTRKSGAGSLAHEWFHGVDNYFARMQGQQSGMMTDRITQDDRVRSEMKDAFRGLMKTINLTGMKQRSQVLDDKRTKEYWTTGLEMAARSFESYVIAKLQDQNASNDYLANIVGETLFALQDAYPYPSAGEMPQIRAAFDHFFDAVQTKEDDAGNVAMFSRSAMKSIDANVRRGMASLAKALDEKTTVHRAMFRNGLGWVDFAWGSEGKVKPGGATKGAMGLSHILEARQRKDGMSEIEAIRLLNDIVTAVASGQEITRNEIDGNVRIGVEHDGTIVWLAKTKGSNAWVVTGYEKNPGDSAAGRATAEPTSTAASLTRDGRVAGFGEIVAQELENGNSDPTFSRGAQTQATQSVEKLVNAIAANWDNAPEIVVAFDMQDDRIPERVRQEDLKQRSGGEAGTPEGFYYSRKVYLMSSQLATPNDVARVLFHESAHAGMRGFFGSELKPILQQIVTMRRKEVEAKLKEYGLRGISEIDKLTAAEEVLAEMAQSQPTIGFVKRAIAIIRTWLRKNVPGLSMLNLSDNEIVNNFIIPARDFIERSHQKNTNKSSSVTFSRRFSEEEKSTAMQRYIDGEKVLDIAADMGIGNIAIYEWLKVAGVATRVPAKKLSIEDRAKVIKMYLDGGSTPQISVAFGVHSSTINSYLKEAGVDRRQPTPDPLRVADARRLYESGLSLTQVADQLGVSGTAIFSWLKSDGLQLRPQAGYSTDIKDEAVRLYAEGMSPYEIARRLNLGEQGWSVRDWAAKAGIGRTLSEATSIAVKNGRVVYSGINTPWQSEKTGRWEMAHSTYELLRMEQLDSDDSVVDWSKKTPTVKYTDPSGKQRTYVPDFLIEYEGGRQVVEEVKPEFQLKDPVVMAKLDAARIQFASTGIEFRVLTQHDIGIDGIKESYRKLREAKAENARLLNLQNEPAAPDSGSAMFSRSMAGTLSAAANERKTKIVGETSRQYTPEQLAAMKSVGFQVELPSLKERAQALWQDAGKKLAQGLVDQFAPIKDIDKDAYGLLRLAKGASGAFEVFMHGGRLKLEDGVYNFDDTRRGGVVDKLLKPLQSEHHDFFRWIAANRADRLKGEGKENLFSESDIASLKTLADGTTNFDYTIQNGVRKGQVTRDRATIYRDSLATFNGFQDNILDMAEQSGLIDGEARKLWEHEFYVPFYRIEDDGSIAGAHIKNGAVRQQAFKSLTGRDNKLNSDLLDNTLMNWAHLLDASAKNRAAKATIEAIEKMGAAIPLEGSAGKGSVWFRENGQKRWALIDDPHLLTAVSALEYAGMRNPVMNAMGSFKRALTIGVTASPFFKIRNLIRDSVQVIGTSGISTNPAANITQGWKLTDPKSDAYFRLMAGGGTIHFGTMMEGSEAKRVQALVESGVEDSTILGDQHKVKAFYRKFIEPGITAYNELGNRGEAINRAALYDQLVKGGMNHADASLQARDLMDFSMQGSFTAIRFLTQVVPFFNARIQGLYKLGRAAKEDPARFSAVLGATALFSLALLAAYGDDDDWKKREEWDRNNFWWFKFGGTAFRIPKPFEIGAIATLAERGFELAFDKEMTGTRFRNQVLTLLGDNLSMNPVPQLVKPILDVYANKDGFSGRPIETMGMDRLQSEYRFTDRTSMTARALSTAANSVTGLVGVESPSPVQIDSMLRGYFGWLGSFVVGAGDVLARPATDQPGHAAPDYWKTATGSMVSDLRDAPSRYVSQMYTQAKEIEQAYGTWKSLQKEGKAQEAAEFAQDNRDKLAKYRMVEHIKKQESSANQRIRLIERSDMDGDKKRELIRNIREQKDHIARPIAL